MKICLIGKNLTNFVLAKNLSKKNLSIDILFQNSKEKKLSQRTLAISKENFNRINGYNEKFVAAEDVDIFRRLRKIGRTAIINKLHVFESPRRYRKEGYHKTLYYWFMNWLYTLCFNKCYSSKW